MGFKKILLAVSIALATPAVFAAADNNITLYGLGTVGIDYTSNGNNWDTIFQDYASRIGFKGADRLDANNSIIWKVENAVNLPGGTGGWARREGWVGYQNDMLGTVRLGHGKNQFQTMTEGFDLFNGNSTLNNMFNNSWSLRYNNAIFYDSPVWQNFSIGASYALDNLKTIPNVNAEKYAAVARYTTTKFALYGAFEQENSVDIDIASSNGNYGDGQNRIRNFAGGGQIMPLQGLMIGALYKNTQITENQNTVWERDATMLIAQYETGNFTPRLGWVHQFKAKNKVGKDDINSANMYIAGLDYKLSKRTYIFAEYSFIDNNEQNAFATTSSPDITVGGAFKNPQSVALGIVTSF